MKFSEIYRHVGETPCSDEGSCRNLYDFILKAGAQDCLELGFAWGKSSCVVAAALQEAGGKGKLMTIDRESARELKPNILEQLDKCGLREFVEPVFSKTSYTWELMRLIEKQTRDGICVPCFDFIFLDGAHLWETDSSAFFLASKLLKPGGYILFDDLTWTLETSEYWSKQKEIQALPEDVRKTPHVERLVTLLVAQSPEYEQVVVRGNWAWAVKKAVQGAGPGLQVINRVYILRALKDALTSRIKKLFGMVGD